MKDLPEGLQIKIYVLKDPIDNYVFYVGQTSTGVLKRMSEHMAKHHYSRHTTPMQKFIQWIVRQGRSPVIEVIDVCEVSERFEIEQRWINHYLTKGFNLFNVIVRLGSRSITPKVFVNA